jgi:hypothetical protein
MTGCGRVRPFADDSMLPDEERAALERWSTGICSEKRRLGRCLTGAAACKLLISRGTRRQIPPDGSDLGSVSAAEIAALAVEIVRTIPADFVMVGLLKGPALCVSICLRPRPRARSRVRAPRSS